MKNAIGNRYGKLIVLQQKRENKRTWYYCKCDCGNEKWIRADKLIGKNPTQSCGCLAVSTQIKVKDITGKRFGRLVAISQTNKKDKSNGSIIWKCKCDCGGFKDVSTKDLRQGFVKSCGCLGKENSRNNGVKLGNLTKEYCVENTNIRNLTMHISKRNTSGIKGVSWDSSRQKWLAQIRFKNKNYNLGRYKNKEDAASARKEAEEKMFGEFLKWYNQRYKNKGDKNNEDN